MIRPMQSTDTPDVLALLEWMDAQPEREVLAPEARTPHDLRLESEDKVCFVDVDEFDGVRTYCALSGFEADHLLEGPLGTGPLAPALKRVLSAAKGSVYAFCARDNIVVRDALEDARFHPMHTTDFYELRRDQAGPSPAAPGDLRIAPRVDFETYRALYRFSEDKWSSRLEWTYTNFEAHARRDDVRMLVLMRGRSAVGFAELEIGETANLTYLAVHPAERGHGYGRVLLDAAIREAFSHAEVRALRARAHDHESAAKKLYTRRGLSWRRSVVTYLRDETA
ncbi:GNAT family N-acetyltransferase [Deinococcus yavapaiensis]|uniref:Ribosomal protein S18 acetylase RimI-like enzyme n=1 Tax=Deinococcus yavapaiensis KR-236 TaxID=694435 RepID=A0A318STW4_9DEIO|nr:GNAT family N-acetyltransferase [Deinococcus yavapaiensis]PYE56676.1 ribosomal protein S18 acetylase RimI-like enzyme [Deinococcus yavapaiensis KR-236]